MLSMGVPTAGGLPSSRPGATARGASAVRSYRAPTARLAMSPLCAMGRSAVPGSTHKKRTADERWSFAEQASDLSVPESPKAMSASQPWLPEAWRTGAFAASSLVMSMLAMVSWSSALADEAQETAATAGTAAGEQQQALLEGVTPQTGLILFLPVLFYLIFVVYRTSFNPRAKPQDFLYFVAGFVVLGNIISIVFFKTRWF